jgi:hypothetical protein
VTLFFGITINKPGSLRGGTDIERLSLAAFAPIRLCDRKEIPCYISNTPADFFQLAPILEAKSDFFSDTNHDKSKIKHLPDIARYPSPLCFRFLRGD